VERIPPGRRSPSSSVSVMIVVILSALEGKPLLARLWPEVKWLFPSGSSADAAPKARRGLKPRREGPMFSRRGYSLVVKRRSPKPLTGVRFSLPTANLWKEMRK
jgi:hypothetical protein